MLVALTYVGFAQEAVPGPTQYAYDTPPAKLRNITFNIGGSFITANDSNANKGIRRGANYGIRYQGGREIKRGLAILVGGEIQYNLSIPSNAFRSRLEWVYIGIPVSIDYETFNKHSGYFVKGTISSGLAKQTNFNMHTYFELDGGILFAADRCRIGVGPYIQYTDNARNTFDATTVGLRLSINLR